jgi:hypothetical protein
MQDFETTNGSGLMKCYHQDAFTYGECINFLKYQNRIMHVNIS